MNRLIAAAVIFALSVGIALGGHFYIIHSANQMIDLLKSERAVTVDTQKISPDGAEKIQREWEKHESFLVGVLPHSELDTIEINIMNFSDFQNQELTEEYIKALNECINRLEHIIESEKPDFKNVF